METKEFIQGLPDRNSKSFKAKADIYTVVRKQCEDGKAEYINLSTALDKFADNVRKLLSADIADMFNFDFSTTIDFRKDTDISKFAKSVKKAFCEKLEKAEKDTTDYLKEYYTENTHNFISTFFAKEIESGRLTQSDVNLLNAVTNNGKVKLTENRDTKDKDGNIKPKDESLNISYKDDNGKECKANYKVENNNVPSCDFDGIIAAYKVAAKATNVNSRYDKANKPKAESVLSSTKKENEVLKAKIEKLESKFANIDMSQFEAFLAWQKAQQSK